MEEMKTEKETSKCSTYSHAFVVGRLAATTCPEQLDKSLWRRKQNGNFKALSAKYYPALIDSTLECEGRETERPDFLKCVCQYAMCLCENEDNAGVPVSLKLNDKEYPCRVCSVKLHFFPYGFVFFSIEIDDSGTDLNDLTNMHSKWKEWNEEYPQFVTPDFAKLLKPLLDLLPENGVFTFQGTKTRMYQIVMTDDAAVRDDLLFEIATFMPIGVVKGNVPDEKKLLKPSEEYFNKMLKENSVSAFDNWKALALNDSFTVLAFGGNFNTHPYCYHYFPLLYMRCLFEEFFCFSRNNRYRTDPDGKVDDNVEQQLEEIHSMDRYYFYDDVSYDFLPSMIHSAMARGMGLYSDRDELMGHIKDGLDEAKRRRADERRRRNDTTLLAVKILASISVFVSIFNLITNAGKYPWLAICMAVLAVVSVYLMFAYSKWWFPFNGSKNRIK